MTMMAGALWGGYGLIISMLAAIASSATTFVISRSLIHRKIEDLLKRRYPLVAELLSLTSLHDWKIIAVTQLNPFVPGSTLGYAFGLSPMSLKRYVLLNGIFMLPLQILFVTTGHSLVSFLISNDKWELALIFSVMLILFFIFSKRMYRWICKLFGVSHGA